MARKQGSSGRSGSPAKTPVREQQRPRGVGEVAAARPARSAATTERDARTLKKIEAAAAAVARQAFRKEDPALTIPTRSRSNTIWNRGRGILEMGDAVSERPLFDLKTARQFMQTMLHMETVRDLVAAGKTSSLRGVFYKAKHTVAGTKENTFETQDESDPILEDLEVSLGSLREELHVFAENRGTMIGEITIIDRGDEIDCRRMGSGGYSIPSIVEPDVIQFKECDADFVLHVEKGTVWARFNEDRFWEQHRCILTHGAGQPPRGVRRLLQRFNRELKLPIVCLLDCDPWGHYIYSVIRQGSISLAFESSRLAIPEARFLGLMSADYKDCGLPESVRVELTETDIKRAREIAQYPWFAGHRGWQKEIATLLSNGFKMEVESLISKGISFITESYVPDRLRAQRWLV